MRRTALLGAIVALGLVGTAQATPELHYCGTTKAGDGFYLEAGKSPETTCSFARATYRAYWRWGLDHTRPSHFKLMVRRELLSCNRGTHEEGEKGELVFDVRCHNLTKFVRMYEWIGP